MGGNQTINMSDCYKFSSAFVVNPNIRILNWSKLQNNLEGSSGG